MLYRLPKGRKDRDGGGETPCLGQCHLDDVMVNIDPVFYVQAGMTFLW